ncbi:MAG TPA: hypothetical protein VN851_02070 [Thermoanaerobaculia bacterium]|nr:hypothetical protein [Thermoanaerobaculia bacterium]
MSTASFVVGQTGEAFTLALAPGDLPENETVVAGDTITLPGVVGTYEFTFAVANPLAFGAPPVVEPIPSLPGITFTLITTVAFAGFTIQLNITASPAVTYTVPFTINTSQGPFDPSIAIEPPDGAALAKKQNG